MVAWFSFFLERKWFHTANKKISQFYCSSFLVLFFFLSPFSDISNTMERNGTSLVVPTALKMTLEELSFKEKKNLWKVTKLYCVAHGTMWNPLHPVLTKSKQLVWKIIKYMRWASQTYMEMLNLWGTLLLVASLTMNRSSSEAFVGSA